METYTRTRPIAALFAAAVLLLAACGDDGEAQPVDEPAATTTTAAPVTTVAATPTTAAPTTTTTAIPEPSGPIKDPATVGEAFVAAFSDRDVEALQALFAPDSRFAIGEFPTELTDLPGWIEFHEAVNGLKQIGTCQVRDSSRGDIVSCRQTATDDFFSAGGLEFTSGALAFVVSDGFIISYDDAMVGPSEFDTMAGYVGGFLSYLEANHPDEIPKTVDPQTGQIWSAAAAQVYLDHVEEWLASEA